MTVTLRQAEPADAAALGEIYLSSFAARYAFPLAHADDEVRAWIGEVVLPGLEVWVADDGGAPVGFLALSGDAVEQLYLAPDRTGEGIGGRLITLAKDRRPGGLELYTFQVNTDARRFYEHHGFVAEWFGDGSTNEERQPDVRYRWRPPG